MVLEKIPIYRLSRAERLWLNMVLILLKENIRFDYKLVWSRLNGKIKERFRPLQMNERLANGNGEKIHLLGIVALQKNYKLLTQCNKVILTIKKIIDANPNIEWLETSTISEKSGILPFETSLILGVINEYGRFYRDAKYDSNNFTVKEFRVAGEDAIFYQYKGFKSIQPLILEKLNRDEADKEWFNTPKQLPPNEKKHQNTTTVFVNLNRLEELLAIKSSNFDFSKLIKLIEEINDNYSRGNYLATAMIGRTILDHIPPIFNQKNFDQVANNYGGANENRSFKKSMIHLNNSLKNIADHHLHSQIRDKEVLPNETQVDFKQDLDVLLSEIIRINTRKNTAVGQS